MQQMISNYFSPSSSSDLRKQNTGTKNLTQHELGPETCLRCNVTIGGHQNSTVVFYNAFSTSTLIVHQPAKGFFSIGYLCYYIPGTLLIN